MRKKVLSALLCVSSYVFSFSVSEEESLDVANKIWKNECGGTVEGLTHWGRGEGFPSLGIGHFIWYANEGQERFEETFPKLIAFLAEKKVKMPLWLQRTKRCPWSSREDFYQKVDTEEMKALRTMLFDTRSLQAIFIIDRFQAMIKEMVQTLSLAEKEKVLLIVADLAKSSKGIYAMVDYHNFKGSGLAKKEMYNGEGWGLLQVFLSMKNTSGGVEEFARGAKAVLQKRVLNAPPERGEEKWLKGWFNRIDTYLQG